MAGADDILDQYSPRPEADLTTTDIMRQYQANQPWGGLRSYMPDQPEWMKSTKETVAPWLSSIPPEVWLAMNFLFRRPGALPSRWENTYHGTADPEFQLQNKTIWSEPGRMGPPKPAAWEEFAKPKPQRPDFPEGQQPNTSNYFASAGPDEPGAIAPLKVDTADYLTVRPGSVLQKLDDKVGSANELYRHGRNWMADLAALLGKKGLRYEDLNRDHGPAILSLDPKTVRSGLDPEGSTPHAPAKMPEYLRRALEEDSVPWDWDPAKNHGR